jgi:transcriptional regulator with XRE-family HTH domain
MEIDAAARLGAALAEARVGAGLTQVIAAKRLGISQSRLAKLETARRRLTFLEAVSLARAYGVGIDTLEAAIAATTSSNESPPSASQTEPTRAPRVKGGR